VACPSNRSQEPKTPIRSKSTSGAIADASDANVIDRPASVPKTPASSPRPHRRNLFPKAATVSRCGCTF
jgi:hypothetical protein